MAHVHTCICVCVCVHAHSYVHVENIVFKAEEKIEMSLMGCF
jgi:hypothetical protein